MSFDILPQYISYYCDLIIGLAHLHAHPKNKRREIIVKGKVRDPLDFDEVGELIDEAADQLAFINYAGGLVWMNQDRHLLEYIQDECEIDLWTISCRFDHLEPPSLRDEFDLPPPTV